MKCTECKEEILAANVNQCPYCNSKKVVPIVKKEVNIPKKLAQITKLEKAGRYGEAIKEYEELGMKKRADNCRKLGAVGATKLEKAGKYGKAVKVYEDLEMWEKAYKSLKAHRAKIKK
jgi:DNA-directed RNA polymerase subunit RPC12/RpoP